MKGRIKAIYSIRAGVYFILNIPCLIVLFFLTVLVFELGVRDYSVLVISKSHREHVFAFDLRKCLRLS